MITDTSQSNQLSINNPPSFKLKFVCDFDKCDKSYNAKGDLKIHKLSHFPENYIKCDFEGCNYSNYRLDHLNSHKKIHLKEKQFKCSLCLSSFETDNKYKNHLKKDHNIKKPFGCDFKDCNFFTTSLEGLCMSNQYL